MNLASGSTTTLFSLTAEDRELARMVHPVDLARELSPRPFLHPVRTLAGTVVSDERPEDHRWHLGVCVALQDVGGTNHWGGRTYVRDQGYVWREDHGTIRCVDHAVEEGHARATLSWCDASGDEHLAEERTLTWAVDDTASAWSLGFDFTLRNLTGVPLSLGSPGSNGRPGGGYGGFFWRLPPVVDHLDVWTPEASGEEAVHGSTAPWLLVRGASGHPDGRYTLRFAPGDEETADDPWFVRAAGYPGVGSSLAWDRPVVLGSGDQLRRRVYVLVADGHLDAEEATQLAQVVARGDAGSSEDDGSGPP